MGKDWLKNIRYLVSPEESRIGRINYWNNIFLAGKTPLNRICLEASKVFVVIALCTVIMIVLNWF